MNYVLPGQPFTFAFESATGLVGTAGVQVLTSAGVVYTARSTGGIVEAPAGSGNYIGAVTAPATAGAYVAVIDDGAPVPAHITAVAFDVVAAPVLIPPGPPPSAPVLGPCSPWIDHADVLACCTAAQGADPALLDAFAAEASMALYEISGRIFPGVCQRTVRPCRDPCGCWGPASLGLGPWLWTSSAFGTASGWSWGNECGERCGCGTLSRVKLAGYPVREILEVKIGGQAVDPSRYRLDGWRWLTALDDPGPPVAPRPWPSCQNLALDDDQPGTFSVTYLWGVDPSELGRLAAADVACQLFAACGSGPCAFPAGVTKVVRQGVQVERQLLANWLDPKKPTGIVSVDLFLQAYWRGERGARPAVVWSPDVQGYAQRLGS